MKILLCNWTHKHNCIGGTENRYMYLKQIFPEAELISYQDLFGDVEKSAVEKALQMDGYYRERENILIIRDASVGGASDISKIPQITIFGNPYISLSEIFGQDIHWANLIKLQLGAQKTIKIAVSNFIKEDMEKNSLEPDEIIPNPVDLDFFAPLSDKKGLKKIYNLPITKKIGMWVGSSEYKNFSMIQRLISKFSNIFWILVFKNKVNLKYRNIKIFYNIDRNVMKELYNCADFFILTSPIEGCNHAIFEAMACNVPCIVSQAGYFWDFFDERIGYRINYNNWEEHLSAVNNIFKKEGLNPRQVLIDRKLDLQSWKDKWLNLLKKHDFY